MTSGEAVHLLVNLLVAAGLSARPQQGARVVREQPRLPGRALIRRGGPGPIAMIRVQTGSTALMTARVVAAVSSVHALAVARPPFAFTKALAAAGRIHAGTDPALKAMTAAEKGELLDALLTDQPALRDRVEALAAARMSAGDRGAVAEEVESVLRGLDIDQLNGRAGYRRGVGYVEPGEAADELLDEALLPFLDDLARRGTLGMTTAAAECAVGILDGLYRCRDGGSESLLEYTPDYGIERASDVVARCRALGVDLPVDDLVELLPEWDAVLRPRGHMGDGRSAR